MSLAIKLWGVRGSLPSPHSPDQIQRRVRETLEEFVQFQKTGADLEQFWTQWGTGLGGYGGNTSCVQVSSPSTSLIVDAGSGIRRLSEQLVCGKAGLGQDEIHILMTHFHWDHLIGLPFFVPIFIPGNKIHFYAVQEDLELNVRNMFRNPNFPVSFESLGASLFFHELEPRTEMEIGDIKFTPYQLDHPDPCWGYRMEHNGSVYSHCVDTECKRVSRKELGPDLPLYQDVDLMVFDAQYSFLEAAKKINWGHASAPIGLDIAMREKIKKILFVHHDPSASDEKIDQAKAQTSEYYESCIEAAHKQGREINYVDWDFAREGLEVEI